jgi:hypothetical protein
LFWALYGEPSFYIEKPTVPLVNTMRLAVFNSLLAASSVNTAET